MEAAMSTTATDVERPDTHRSPRARLDARDRQLSLLGGGLALVGAVRAGRGRLPLALAAGYLVYRGVTGHGSLAEIAAPAPRTARRTVTVERPPQETAQFLRSAEGLDALLGTFGLSAAAVQRIDEPDGRRMAWRSTDGVEIFVDLTPGPGGGTVVEVAARLAGRGTRLASQGWPGAGLEARLREGLRRLKQRLESGELPTTASQPAGERTRFGRLAERFGGALGGVR
jgi:uncharacterized membrane protein